MTKRTYYSVRTGRNAGGLRYDLPMLKRLFLAAYNDLLEGERFQEFLGKDCVDNQDLYGTAGRDVASFFLRRLRKDGLWPIHEKLESYSEDDLFDVIELLHDHVSVGVDGYEHSFAGCGMHYSTFDSAKGRAEFRDAMNDLLVDYSTGFALSADGEILHAPESGFDNLVSAELPHPDQHNVTQRIDAAVRKYRSRSSNVQDRRDAVRGLIDVLEYLRPQLKEVFATKDEADLFNIANNFGLRHHNDRQRTDYDPKIWTSWMFYFYLATVHAAVRLLERHVGPPA
jgi:hypothetical protein